ncbi:unnamed protein product [Brassica rapa subsp. trilocularis]
MGEHNRNPFAIASASGSAGGSTSASSDSSFSSSVADTDDDQTIARMLAEDESLRSEGKLGRRLSHLGSIPHTPRVNRQIPDLNDATLDHDLLSGRLATYGLAELQMEGDGNCQAPLADQLFRNADYHKHVRKHVVKQVVERQRKLYEEYVPMKYRHYRRKMKKPGAWGDHVTLQAAADRVLLPPTGHTMQSSQAGWKNETNTLIYGPHSHIHLLTHMLICHSIWWHSNRENLMSNSQRYSLNSTLPKGRKMLTKYIRLLAPGSEIARVVCMAGSVPPLEIPIRRHGATSAECLPCSCGVSSEQPPLRPIGSSAGDGGSVVLISHLERAAEVVVDSRT